MDHIQKTDLHTRPTPQMHSQVQVPSCFDSNQRAQARQDPRMIQKPHHHQQQQQQQRHQVQDPRKLNQRQHQYQHHHNANKESMRVSDAPFYNRNNNQQPQPQRQPLIQRDPRNLRQQQQLQQQSYPHRGDKDIRNKGDESTSTGNCSSGDDTHFSNKKKPNYNRNRCRNDQPFHHSFNNNNSGSNINAGNTSTTNSKKHHRQNSTSSYRHYNNEHSIRNRNRYESNPRRKSHTNSNTNNSNHYYAGRQPRYNTHHHWQQHNGNMNVNRRMIHSHHKNEKINSSVALHGYLKDCGWSLPPINNDSDYSVPKTKSETIRKRSLALLETTLRRWTASIEKKNEEKVIVNSSSDSNISSGQQPEVTLVTFGSYRLGAYRPDADVDLLALCPPFCTREDFFTSLVTLMEDEPSICEIHPIASAFTPVLKFTINSINFDMLFGRVNGNSNIGKLLRYQQQQLSSTSSVAKTTTTAPVADAAFLNTVNKADIDGTASHTTASVAGILNVDHDDTYGFPIDDSFLTGMDDYEIRSANGVRVTQYIMDYVAHPDRFRIVLSAVKEWAMLNGIYSNVLGFFGGVNWAIMVAYVCKRYPSDVPTSLLKIFFQTFSTWSWPNPVLLESSLQENQQVTVPEGPTMVGGMKPWDPQTNPRDARHVMPIITPVFPRMNSSYNVGISQQRRIQEELSRAAFLTRHEVNWRSLYSRNNFFDRHANFLQITIRSQNPDEFTKWLRLCESRLRILVCALDSPEMSAWPYAQIMKRFYTPVIDDNSAAKSDEKNNNLQFPEALFFIGLRFARNVKSIDLKQHTTDFLVNQINAWDGRKPGMDFMIEHVLQRDLPHNTISEHINNERIMYDIQTSSSFDRTFLSDDQNSVTNSADEPLRPQEMTQSLQDEMNVGSRLDSPMNKLVKFDGVPPPQGNSNEEQREESDDISNKINQEQLFNFLTGNTEDLPPCIGSNDECTSTGSEDLSSTMSPIHKRPRNRSRSGTEDSDLLSENTSCDEL